MKGRLFRPKSFLGHTQALYSSKSHGSDGVPSLCSSLSHSSRHPTPSRYPAPPSETTPLLGARFRHISYRHSDSHDKSAFLTDDIRPKRGYSAHTQTCKTVNDLIISQATQLHATERLNTLRMSSDLRSVLSEINRSVRTEENPGTVTIAMEDKVKAWKEYNEENKRVVVLTKACVKPERQERLVRRKFLMATLRKQGSRVDTQG